MIIEKYTYYQTEKTREKTIAEEKLKQEQTEKQLDKTKNDITKPNTVTPNVNQAKPAVADTLNDSVKDIKLKRLRLEEQKLRSESDSTKKAKKIPD